MNCMHARMLMVCLAVALMLGTAAGAMAQSADETIADAPAPVFLDAAPEAGEALSPATAPGLFQEPIAVSGCGFPPPQPPYNCYCGGCCECARCWNGGRLQKCVD